MYLNSKAKMEKKLAEMKEGEKGKVLSIDGGQSLRRNLQNMGIREGKVLMIHARQPAGGPIVIKIDNMTLTLGRGMAQKILVEIQ